MCSHSRQTSIGRALNNDVVLMDPTVSREHARLVLDHDGWHIINLTARNIVRVNGQPVPSGSSLPMHPQDVLILGSTMLQLIAPQNPQTARSDEHDLLDDITQVLPSRSKSQPAPNAASNEQQRHTPSSLLSLPQLRVSTVTCPVITTRSLIMGMREHSDGMQNGLAQPPEKISLPDTT